ncbi:MAG: HAMP domain-containing sensor histidine kinase [Elusimicrobiota bacterium]
MNRRFLATVLLSSLIPVLLACAGIYRTTVSNPRRDIVNALSLEAEYSSKEIAGYLGQKKKTADLLSGLGMFSVAVEYQRFEGLTRFFDSMVKNERDCLGICFLNKQRKIQANNEFANDGRFLNDNRESLACYVSGIDFKNERAWQFVEVDAMLTPVVVSKVFDKFNEHAGYLVVLLNRAYFEDLLSTFAEKYKRMHAVDLQYLVAVRLADKYRPITRSTAFRLHDLPSSGRGAGYATNGGVASIWNATDEDAGIRVCFQARADGLFARLSPARTGFWIVVPLFVIVIASLTVFIIRHSFRPIELLLSKMEDMSKGNYSKIDPGNNTQGDKYISYANTLIDRILKYEEAHRMEAQLSALGELASQVAHDIRSPLAALDSVTNSTANLPEEKRILIRGAISRIRDIANQLIERTRKAQTSTQGAEPDGSPVSTSAVSVELLSSHIELLITEKRMQFRPKIGVDIEARLDAASYGLFVRMQPTEFKRVLSNLINNAVEAVSENGTVRVFVWGAADQVVIQVKDSGKGIPPEILPKLGRRGETHEKAGGSGLGLYHAKSTMESWGGSLAISSELGRGTTVTLTLPQAQAPAWFVPRLEVAPGSRIVVLDDDASIHQVWQGRFESACAKEHGIESFHFSTPEELRGWARAHTDIRKDALYLMDYELIGYRETGLELIEELGLSERAILITSRFEEKGVLESCRRLKVRMIPKGLAAFVPISIADAARAHDAVLLDNDALVHMTWRIAAESKGVRLSAFRTPEELLSALERMPKDMPIYIDSELDAGQKGEDVAKDLHAHGFTELYLATGYDPESLPPMPWIKRVVGKEPPWADA